jgi:hypothetical protein
MQNNWSEIKLWIFNSAAVAFTLTGFQDWLKIIILILTIGYTIRKWWLMETDKNKKDEHTS